eukprot:Gb_36771 [translate_table: standard]
MAFFSFKEQSIALIKYGPPGQLTMIFRRGLFLLSVHPSIMMEHPTFGHSSRTGSHCFSTLCFSLSMRVVHSFSYPGGLYPFGPLFIARTISLIIRRSCRIVQDATCIEEPTNGIVDVISIARIKHGMNLRNMCSLSRWSSGDGGR